jgi:hypothetical protein
MLFSAGALLGEAQVHDLGQPPRRHEDVRGLDVAVDHPLGGRRLQTARDVEADGEHAFEGQRSVLVDRLHQRPPLDELHDDVGDLRRMGDVEDTHHVRMIELGGETRLLAQELGQEGTRAHHLGLQQLQGHRDAVEQLGGAIDGGEAAGAEQLLDPVLVDHRSDRRQSGARRRRLHRRLAADRIEPPLERRLEAAEGGGGGRERRGGRGGGGHARARRAPGGDGEDVAGQHQLEMAPVVHHVHLRHGIVGKTPEQARRQTQQLRRGLADDVGGVGVERVELGVSHGPRPRGAAARA